MEYGSRARYALFAVGGLILLILSIWGLTSLARRVIRGDSNKPEAIVKQTDLKDFNKKSSFVRVSVEGPVVANEKFQSYQIDVGQDYRELKVFNGYDKKVVAEKRYTNNSDAFDMFLKALKLANFTSQSTKTYGDDESGYCATGNRYVYQLFDAGEQIEKAWGVSCGASIGTFTGNGPAVRSLFKSQIPDFAEVMEAQRVSL